MKLRGMKFSSALTGLGLVGSMALAWGGCAPDSDIPTYEESSEREAGVKGSGLCGETNTCGGQSADGCWCDVACAKYGDCCEDVSTVCGTHECFEDKDCGENGACLSIQCIAAPCPSNHCVDATPAPDLCLTDGACGADRVCDHSECHSGCPDGSICPAVCYGECVDAPAPEPEPVACGSNECGPGTFCCNASCGICAPEGGFCTQQACGPVDPPPPPAPDSCVDQCGGPSQDESCYCDDLCEQYGDCCADYAAICS